MIKSFVYDRTIVKNYDKNFKSILSSSHSGGSTVLNESDPFTDSDYMELGVNLQEELDISKE